MSLYHLLKQYGESDAYPFHMPGHKRREGALAEVRALDITEIEGFDNLHHAEGILKEAQERAARLYGSEDTFYLVNGSTAGILAAVCACTEPGGKILMARNSHKAAYHAAQIRQLETVYLYPQYVEFRDGAASNDESLSGVTSNDESLSGAASNDESLSGMVSNDESLSGVASNDESLSSAALNDESLNGAILSDETSNGGLWNLPGGSIRPEDVRAALEADSRIEAVFLTSPTYEGVVSNVKEIAKIVHSFDIPLIVDEAHGAHFGFHPYFPESSVKAGADLVVHSLHKTMPSLTQTALLHRNGDLISREKIEKFLDIFQTSSPSYVLMAGMDACVELMEQRGGELFEEFSQRLEEFSRRMRALRHIRLMFADGGESALCTDCVQNAVGKNAKHGIVSNARDATGRNAPHPIFGKDPSKLILQADGHSGKWLSDELRARFHLELEMAAGGYAVALTSIADTPEGFARLFAALGELDAQLENEGREATRTCETPVREATQIYETSKQCETPVHKATQPYETSELCVTSEQVCSIAEAERHPRQRAELAGSVGKVSAEYLYLYPPGIPMIVPGERISGELVAWTEQAKKTGLSIQGLSDPDARTILFCTDII